MNVNDLLDFIRDEVEEHRKTLDPGSPRDFIDAYLLEIEKVRSSFTPSHIYLCANYIILVAASAN